MSSRLRTPAVLESLRALVATRALIWLVGVPAVLIYGYASWEARDPFHQTERLGAVGRVLGAPAVRWDSSFYVEIADHGYASRELTAFFPLYPYAMRALGLVTGSVVVAGVLISFVAFTAALVALYRLSEIELGAGAASRAVWLAALFPGALFFSAVYTESLFLALTVGAVYAARRGRWGWAGVAGGLAALTRNSGFLVLVPVALLYFYGPRADAPQPPALHTEARGWWLPRHPLRRDALWLALIPAGLALFCVYTAHFYGDALATFHAQTIWSRHFAGPFSAVWYGAKTTWQAFGHILDGGGSHGTAWALRQIALAGVVAFAFTGALGALRRLPPAYGGYVLAALLPALSFPWKAHPLWATPRFVAVLFPIFMWLALRLRERRSYLVVAALFALGLAYASASFATWHWVA